MADDRKYISQVVLPGSAVPYYIKDSEAREMISALGNATHFMGVTSQVIEDGDTVGNVTIGETTVLAADIHDGYIVISKTSELDDAGAELICATIDINGTPTKKWFMCGSTKVKGMGDLAQYDTVSLSGSVGYDSIMLESSSIDIDFGETIYGIPGDYQSIELIGPSFFDGQVFLSQNGFNPIVEGSITVNSSASFSGNYSIPSSLSQGTITKNEAGTPFSLSAVSSATTGAVALVTAIPSSAEVTGSVTVGGTTVYGLSSTVTDVVTGVTSTTASTGIPIAVVSSEILTLYNISASTTTKQEYTVGASGSYSLTDGAATIGSATTQTYKVAVGENTFVTNIADPTINWTSSTVTVVGSAVTTSSVTVQLTDSVPISILSEGREYVYSMFYFEPVELSATVSAYAGGDTIVTNVFDDLSVKVSKNS